MTAGKTGVGFSMSTVDSSSSSSDPVDAEPDVAIIGLGYVGLTLAAALASTGLTVLGVEHDPVAAAAIRAGGSPFYEVGLVETLASLPPGRIRLDTSMPDRLPPAVVICVGTPVDSWNHEPDLTAFDQVVVAVAERVSAETLVVVRSTVPVGTTQQRVLPQLAARVATPLLAFCPERIIQGQALNELRQLPQVIGALNAASAEAAERLFGHLVDRLITVSSPAAAELVKLVNNAHTDIIYGFGNEVAQIAEVLRLDAEEVIHAANLDYPRPDISRPGFVGGSCLTKDPYLLLHSVAPTGLRPALVASARAVNESVPAQVVDRVLTEIKSAGHTPSTAKVLVCGIAYKGRPVTDDVRGSAASAMVGLLADRVGSVLGQDFLVSDDRIAALGYQPTSLLEGLRDATAVLFLVDHPDYATLEPDTVAAAMRSPAIVFDMWGVLSPAFDNMSQLRYLRWGRG
ncbi:nucleotide sugar dehydrogenase [Micromonospora sp. NPDC049662]|uniref:nucleotide sugar dehydrogenase n=1 Tax=Micromonospora sp. NPDC049662 TaxID=3155397 RepID=UPI0034335C41